MFTGLIQALGTIRPVGNDQFEIICVSGQPHLILQDLAIGDSVAVDGVCLTVTQIRPQGFVAIASPETLSRTTLGQDLTRPFNLEASLRAGSKLGGHFVTGHVDGVGCLVFSKATARSWEMRFARPDLSGTHWQNQIAPYLVPKGSIAVNGISLTVADCDPMGQWFTVAVIPHTYEETNLNGLQSGDWVNLEADILGKYAARFLQARLDGSLHAAVESDSSPASSLEDITPEFLIEHGFS
ncbi:MAG: riboflavin synthase [Microcoleaceae cyanobacterium]